MIKGIFTSASTVIIFIEGRIFKGSLNIALCVGYLTAVGANKLLYTLDLKSCTVSTTELSPKQLTSAHLEELLDIIELMKVCNIALTGGCYRPGVMNDTVESLKKASESNLQCSEQYKKDLH